MRLGRKMETRKTKDDGTLNKRRLELPKQGGVIIQLDDGSLQAVSPGEAKKHMAAMEPERRALYATKAKKICFLRKF